MRWLVGEFEPVALFSLRPSYTTASGGQTLLAPTPFAIKMALLDASCRVEGVQVARRRWQVLRALQVAWRPPSHVVVSRTFQRVLKPRRSEAKGEEEQGPFQRTIAYREYAYFADAFGLALGWEGEDHCDWLSALLVHVSYFGKRGSFVQLRAAPRCVEELPRDYVMLTKQPTQFPIDGVLQALDDCSLKVDFEAVNVYNKESSLSKMDRLRVYVVLPYRQQRSTRAFAWYERLETD